MAKSKRGKSRGKGRAKGRSRRGRRSKEDNRIPLDVLEKRLGRLSTIVAKRGGKMPRYTR